MVAMREGDWMCPSCNNHNFASRQTCNKCAGPRVEGGAPMQPQTRSSPYGSAPRPTQSPASEKPMMDGDWMCPGCGNHNFASRVNCNRCQALREGFKQGDWICRNTACKNHNFANRMACNKCQAPRPHDTSGAPARPVFGGCGGGGCYGGGGGYGPFGGKGGMMYGGNGGMMQGKGGFAYGAYGAPCMGGQVFGGYQAMQPMMASPVVPYSPVARMASPSGKPMKDGDWICPGCNNHNFASRVNCNKCKQIRQGFKEGDWICRECKNHNFKSRTECNKCNAPKPA